MVKLVYVVLAYVILFASILDNFDFEYKEDNIMRKCKLCGSKAELITSEDVVINKYVKGYKVICHNLGCNNKTDWYGSEEQAISAWQDLNKK